MSRIPAFSRFRGIGRFAPFGHARRALGGPRSGAPERSRRPRSARIINPSIHFVKTVEYDGGSGVS